jgi:hypothetical protein
MKKETRYPTSVNNISKDMIHKATFKRIFRFAILNDNLGGCLGCVYRLLCFGCIKGEIIFKFHLSVFCFRKKQRTTSLKHIFFSQLPLDRNLSNIISFIY